MTIKPSVVEELQDVVGKDNVIDHPEDLLVFEYDGSIDKSLAQVVVLPSTTEEVSRTLSLAYIEGRLVVGRGSGTGLRTGEPFRRCEELSWC